MASTSRTDRTRGKKRLKFAEQPHHDTLAKEVFHFYVQRNTDRQLHGHRAEVKARQTVEDRQREDVNHEPRFYTDDQCRHMVRIPGLMYFSCLHSREEPLDRSRWNWMNQELRGHLTHRMRHQFGVHIFINQWEMVLSSIYTFYGPVENGLRQYYTEEDHKVVNNVYPSCRRIAPNPIELVMGVGFVNPIGNPNVEHTRTYGAYANHEDNVFAFDITPNFVMDPHEATDKIRHYTNQEMFPHGERAHAIYVCKGARLLLLDPRTGTPPEVKDIRIDKRFNEQLKANPKYTRDQAEKWVEYDEFFLNTRSLIQQGGLLVLRGTMQFIVGYDVEGKDAELNYYQFTQQYLSPQLTDEKADETERLMDGLPAGANISDLQRKVIFIGAAESQHNSVAWQVRIVNRDQPGNTGHRHHCLVRVPEGGHIVDICSWNAGFRQIYRRLRYERSHLNVVETNNMNIGGTFQIPSGYYHSRILGAYARSARFLFDGISNKYDEKQVHRDYGTQHRPNDTDDFDIRRYVSQRAAQDMDSQMSLIERHNQRNMWYCPPPLYPPIYRDNAFWYIYNPNNKVLKMADEDKYYVKDGPDYKYELKKKTDATSYPWMWCNRESLNRLKQMIPNEERHGQWLRLGIDYQLYMKFARPVISKAEEYPTLGQMKTYYLSPFYNPADSPLHTPEGTPAHSPSQPPSDHSDDH